MKVYNIKKFEIKFQFEIIVFSLYFVYLALVRYNLPFFTKYLFFSVGEGDFDWDMYFRMSRDVLSIFNKQIVAPFCYRPLIPFFAGILPFDLQTNYALITFISVYFTGILLYMTLRLKFNKLLSLVGLLLFVFLNHLPDTITFAYGFSIGYFYNVYNIDAPALFFLMGCFYSIFSSKKKLYLIFLVLGTLTKEFVLLTIPVFFFYETSINENENKKEKIVKSFTNNYKYIIPAVFFYVVLQLTVVPLPTSESIWYDFYDGNDYGSIGMFLMFMEHRIHDIFFEGALFTWTLGVWSVLIISFCTLTSFKNFRHWLAIFGFYMVITYLQIFLGYASSRYILYGFYPVIYLAISGINNCFNPPFILMNLQPNYNELILTVKL